MVKYSAYFDNKSVLDITPGDEPTVEIRVYDTFSGNPPTLGVSGHVIRLGTDSNTLSPTAASSTVANLGILTLIFTAAVSSLLLPGKQDAQLEVVLTSGKQFIIPLTNSLNVRAVVF